MKMRVALAVCVLVIPFSISSCGVVEIDNGCVAIKKQSEDFKDLGKAFLEKADSGQVDESLSVQDVESEGYKYLTQGIQLVIDNPQCFSTDEVLGAKFLLGQSSD